MKNNIFLKSLILLVFAFVSCEDFDPAVDVSETALSFSQGTDEFEVRPDASTYQIEVQSTRTSDYDRVITVVLNEDESNYSSDHFTFDNTVTIPAGSYVGHGSINFDYDQLVLGQANTLTYDLMLPEDGTIFNNTRTSTTITYSPVCIYSTVSLSITTDDWPDETSWELFDLNVSTTVPIASGGPLVNPDDDFQTIEVAEWCLDSGNYGVIVHDSYGDGISGGGFEVIMNGAVIASGIVGPSANPGSIPSSGSATFTLP